MEGLPGEHVVTGVGKFALKAVQDIELKPSDSVINVGCAAGLKGGCYLVNSVTDKDTGRRFYPDMPADPALPEAPLITSSSIVTVPEPGYLYDMEASLILSHVMKKTAPSRIAIVKAVSDDGSRRPAANEVTALIRSYREEIGRIIGSLCLENEPVNYMPLPGSVYEELRLSQYMKNEFEDLVHYCAVSGKLEKLNGILDEMRANGILPVRDKRQGRRVLDEIFTHIR
ncbi:MAG: hypothetical protein K6E60_07185 [Saccharofermentans sp.]|nr:hypothetical protein [Saccharofermentans sp.]